MEITKEYLDGLDKRTNEYKEAKAKFEAQSSGLGDTVEKITKKTGIKKAVKFIAGDDCGCDERKDKLNKLFPYRKPDCLEENEYFILKEFYSRNRLSISSKQQQELLSIHNRIFKQDMQMSDCATCVKELVKKLEKVWNLYK